MCLTGRFCAAIGLAGAITAAHAATVRVLFIGNSYTFVNNVPEMVAAMAPKDVQLVTSMVAEGGLTLADHWANPKTRQIVRSGHWDFVVLQEQSALGTTLYVDGLSRVGSPAQYIESAKRWCGLARATGAKPLVLEFWPLRDAPARDWQALRYAHSTAARLAGAQLIPVGEVWMRARRHIGSSLYQADGSHATPLGSYLEAAAVAHALFGVRVGQLPLRIAGHPIGLDEARHRTVATLVDVTKLQRSIINDAIGKSRTAIATKAPPTIMFPQMPRAERLAFDVIKGTWTGSTTLFPRFLRFPATFTLTIRSMSDGDITFGFAGKPEDISRRIDKVTIGKDRFTLVAGGGPNGSYYYIVGVRLGTTLKGIAEMILPNGSVLAIGTWKAARVANRSVRLKE